ncbi:MAG: membrane protein insertase YidC [Gemmatimonadetes bacterium]|nr:membrane protein insertase YidC [Gemmatimonadota bacterium]MSR35040.1 membrane protein insertase YidC [Gemmatimonadota bacterium]
MRTELRFLLAIGMMFIVLVGTNMLFPPIVPEPGIVPDSLGSTAPTGSVGSPPSSTVTGAPPAAVVAGAQVVPAPEVLAETRVTVESPLYRLEFSSYGARLVSAELPRFRALNQEGVVDLVPAATPGYFGQALVVGNDTLDLARAPFTVEPAGGLSLAEGGSGGTLRFTYEDPERALRFEISYTFDPGLYVMSVEGRVEGVARPLLLTDLGEGIAFAEADSAGEARMMAYAYNHLDRGIESTALARAEPQIVQGPLLWAAFRSKFFVTVLLAGESDATTEGADYLGGLILRPGTIPDHVGIATAQGVGTDGRFAYRLFLGPQEYASLSSLGQDLEEVNPYGWRFLRPVLRPIVSVILTILTFLHTNLTIGYGWVLVVFGVAMRIVLFPLNHKAMKAQMRNMEVQPLLQEIQKKYKDQPEKLQKEMLRLYKEHGFNPLAGCLPLLLPWPILIALFFVFQNTIELRGVAFLWLPDLSTKDPLYILPMILAGSMFLMQWLSMKSIEAPNPQMKMMMWMMPPMMLLIFLNLASGLNLYYVVSNIATIPQQMWISNERKKMKGRPPLKLKDD